MVERNMEIHMDCNCFHEFYENFLNLCLPGTGDTVIMQAVPPGGDCGIALCSVDTFDLSQCGRLVCAMFAHPAKEIHMVGKIWTM